MYHWIVWRIGGQKSHPGLHRVRSSAAFMRAVTKKIKPPNPFPRHRRRLAAALLALMAPPDHYRWREGAA